MKTLLDAKVEGSSVITFKISFWIFRLSPRSEREKKGKEKEVSSINLRALAYYVSEYQCEDSLKRKFKVREEKTHEVQVDRICRKG